MFTKYLDRRKFIAGSLSLSACSLFFGQDSSLAIPLNSEIDITSLNGWALQNPLDIVSMIEKFDISGIGASAR